MQPVAGLIEVMRVARYVEIGQYATDAPDVAGIQPSGVASIVEPPQSRVLDLHPGIFVRYIPCCNPEHPANESISFCARAGLRNPDLARAMARARTGFIDKRRAAVEALPEYPELRRVAREIKEHTLQHLDHYLERFEARVHEHGGHVHWAGTPAEARAIVLDVCRTAGAKRVTKGKSMVGEEIALMAAWAKRRKERAAGGTG